MTFRIGQKVVCVLPDGGWCPLLHDERGPAKGDILTVGSVTKYKGVVGLAFDEYRNPSQGLGRTRERHFNVKHFRPAVERKTDISVFTEMLKPKTRELVNCGND
jgi:hypothetical protein